MNRLEDGIEKEGFDITTWKLSQVMNERLSNLTFLDEMRLLLIGNARP